MGLFSGKVQQERTVGQAHCLETVRTRAEVGNTREKDTDAKETYCVTRDKAECTTNCASYWSQAMKAESILLIVFLELF